MHLLFKIAITELAFDYFTLITIYMNYYQFDGLDSIPKKVGALRFSLKRYFKFHFAVSNKCSDQTFVHPSNAAITSFKSFCAIAILFLIKSFDASFKIGPESAFAEGKLTAGIQNLKSSRVFGFLAKEKGNLFDTIILKKS